MATWASFATCALFAILIANVAPRLFGPLSSHEQLRNYEIVPPWLVYTAALRIAWGLDMLRNFVIPPQLRMIEHSLVFSRTQVAHVLAAFYIPDHLAGGPLTAAELAHLAGVKSEDGLWRVLRLAVVQGQLNGETDRAGATRFYNNRLSATLRSDHPNSVRSFVLLQGQEMFPVWSSLVPALRSGNSAWDEAHPQQSGDLWDYLNGKPDVQKLFSESMAASDSLSVPALLRDYEWGRFSRFIDIGGAHGTFLAAILRAHPSARGVLSDLPPVVKQAKTVWETKHAELLPRVTLGPGGSFFDSGALPEGVDDKDIYILRIILHDWNDDKALQILQSVRTAIGTSNATLAVLELVPSDGVKEVVEGRLYMDVQMYLLCDGRERSKIQWEKLLDASGFKLNTLTPTRGSLQIVEALPV